jgi:hypothetical protein
LSFLPLVDTDQTEFGDNLMSYLRRFSLRFLVALLLAVCASTALSTDKSKDVKARSDGKPVLWRDPGNIASKDLFWGSAGKSNAPKPPLKFVEEDPKGTQPKVEVTDANGDKWKVKFGPEVHAETAATRLIWALGYGVEETYYVASGKIDGITSLGRAKEFIAADGTFKGARFERRPKNIERTKIAWAWGDNPFVGTKELSGLGILMTMINNWDTRRVSKNNIVLRVTAGDGTIEDWYIVEDLGSSFGKMGRYPYLTKRNRWDLEDFKAQKFIDGVSGSTLDLHYKGGARSINKIPLEHARWFAGLASQLNERQIRSAFEAAGATPAEISGFSARIMEKIRELQSAVDDSPRP